MYVLTESGQKIVNLYIRECKAKRKEILDAGKDTADETDIPTAEDILADAEYFEFDEDGEYINGWGVTDNYCADEPICLKLGVDIVAA